MLGSWCRLAESSLGKVPLFWLGICPRCLLNFLSSPSASSYTAERTLLWASCISAHPATCIHTWSHQTWWDNSSLCKTQTLSHKSGWSCWRSRQHAQLSSHWCSLLGEAAPPSLDPDLILGRPEPFCRAQNVGFQDQTFSLVGKFCLC